MTILRSLFLALFAATLLFSSPSTAAELTSIRVQENASVPAIRPDWPIPREANQVFYIQRSMNSNTIVYTALFDGNGNLAADRPAQVYWMRYASGGGRMGLRTLDRAAYGIRIQPRDTAGEYMVSVRGFPQMRMLLRQTGRGKAELYARIGGKTVRAVYAHLTVDESGLLPDVTQVSLHGIDPASGRAISETFRVTGGSFNY